MNVDSSAIEGSLMMASPNMISDDCPRCDFEKGLININNIGVGCKNVTRKESHLND